MKDEVLNKLDEYRGLVKRSTYIEYLIAKQLKKERKNKSLPTTEDQITNQDEVGDSNLE